jgi:hypothetical protein
MKMKQLGITALTFVAIILAPLSLRADHFGATWLEHNFGIWEHDGVWSTEAYPNNGHTIPGPGGEPVPGPNPTYDVLISIPAPCTLGRFVRIQTLNVLQGSTLNLGGNGGYLWANTGFGNAGLITLNATGNFSGLLRTGADSNVVQGGEIFMTDHFSNSVTAGSPGKVLTIFAGGRIRGAGNINAYHGDDVRTYFQIVNHGLIEAIHPNNPLRLFLTDDPAFANSMINDGTVRASGQAVLSFSNFNNFANVLNQGGTIEAIDNGTVRVLNRSTITGGTLATSGNGTIRGEGGTLNNVLNTGTVAIGNGEHFVLAGTFTNNGTVTMTGGVNWAVLRFADGAVLGGTGTLTLAGSGPNYIMASSGTQAMTIASGATLQGHGSISPGFAGGSDMLRITNQGLVHANVSGATLSIRAEVTPNTPFTNSGTLRASNGGTLAFNGTSTLTNNGGTLHVLAGSTISATGGINLLQTAGTIDLDGGTMTFPAGVDLNGGQLIGNGTFNGPIRNNGGIVAPGHSAGKITVNGNYTQGTNGVLDIEIGGTTPGTGYDQLRVNGTATLGGTLNVTLINGFQPAVGDVFQIIAPNAFSGAFATINTVGFSGTVNYSSSGITLTVNSSAGIPLNISTRMHVGTDPNQLIGGFIITGSAPKKVIVLATGPSLAAFGITDFLADPIIELYQGNTLIGSNDNWKNPAQAEIEATGLKPGHDLESALVRTLDPGAYTAVIRGTNGTGVGTVQVYDLSPASQSKLANISSRGFVQTADDRIMIAGFIIGGSGGGNSGIVVRAIAPSLSSVIAGVLPDPTLELKDANGSTLVFNDDWQQSPQAADISARGLAPSHASESALGVSLSNGAYTAIVRGKAGATGVAVVEVYNVD